ncbi:MAG: nuclear transport factor 2 family protein [Acidobacteria bacterium]|nr:nuclear transport factor 2 family protein [Acidobacteriota bacterium]
MTRSIVSVAVLAFLAGPAAPAAAPGASPPALRAEVEAFVAGYIDAHNGTDRGAVMEMFCRQPEVSWVEMGAIIRGWESIRAGAGVLAGELGTHRVSLGAMDVSPLGPDHALVVAPLMIELATVNGDAQIRGAMTLVLEKASGRWRVLHEHVSLQFPIGDFGGEG